MRIVLSLILCTCLLSSTALAGSGAGAINLTFNTSARANGMGEAGVGVTWGTDTNHWANPALLAFRPGLHYLSFETQLATGLADDLFLTNEEVTFGAYGVTFLWAKGPVGGNHLDMGLQVDVDENGQVTEEFQSYMQGKSWGLGVDLVSVLERVQGKPMGTLSRYASLAVGLTWHDYKDRLAVDSVMQDGGGESAESSARSQGIVLRVMPLDLTREGGVNNNGLFGLKAAGSYGVSVLNKTDQFIVHGNNQEDPFPRTHLRGWSLDAQITLADDALERMHADGIGFLGELFNPLLSITYAGQLSEPGYIWNGDGYEYQHDTSGMFEEKSNGWELGLANVFFFRRGHHQAEYGDIDSDTQGGGWKIQAGKLGGFRKDWADVPQASGLPTAHRSGWSFWLNPLEIKNNFF